MEFLTASIIFLIILFGIINLARMSFLLIGSDLYNVWHQYTFKDYRPWKYPTMSIVIPAYNEEISLVACLDSLFATDYPKDRLEVIVVNDGSTDNTSALGHAYKAKYGYENLIIVDKPNGGKADALNLGIKEYATGKYIMCLDADSRIDKYALKNIIKYFRDPRVKAVASHVKIERTKGLLNLVQQFEYLVSYQMKRAQSFFNIEYIIGGIGSAFRRDYLEEVGFYDKNTVTEDIDLSMKMIKFDNKNVRLMYAADSICYTQGVLTVNELVKQRFRWKWGRCQTFLKNRHMFFSRSENHTKGISWFYLPFAIWNDMAFIFEPLIVGFIFITSFIYLDFITVFSSWCILTFYLSINVLAEETITPKDKIKFLAIGPIVYVLFYILSYVEYVALLKSIYKLPTLKESLTHQKHSWTPVQRANITGVAHGIEIPAEITAQLNATQIETPQNTNKKINFITESKGTKIENPLLTRMYSYVLPFSDKQKAKLFFTYIMIPAVLITLSLVLLFTNINVVLATVDDVLGNSINIAS